MMIFPPPEFAGKDRRLWSTQPSYKGEVVPTEMTFSLHAYADETIHLYPNTKNIYNLTPEMAEALAVDLIYAAKIARGEIIPEGY